MAKRGRGGRKIYLQMEHSISLGALAAADVAKGDFTQTVDHKVYALWAKGSWRVDGATAAEGPINVGFAHNDYTAAEIEECIESTASWDAGDKVAQEQRRRKVRHVGALEWQANTAAAMQDGKEQYTVLKFMVEEGQTIATWARTRTLLTTGITLTFSGIICCAVIGS